MAKSNFLLVDLNEPKTKKLAETITSDTSRKILNHLAEKEDAEAKIAESLQLPISTVHYHLQKLQEAGLVKVEEFHYSPKGREVNHYKLANKYIIIAPQKVSGLREKLKGILPIAGLMVLGSAIIKVIQEGWLEGTAAMEKAVVMEAEDLSSRAAAQYAPAVASQPDIAAWFLIGSLAILILYLLLSAIMEYLRKKE